MADRDAGGIDAELLVRNLRKRRLQALPVRLDADKEDERAIRHELRRATLVAWNEWAAATDPFAAAVAGLLGIARKAHADAPPVGLTARLPSAHGGKVD